MGVAHIRTPKNFVLEERLERYASAIEPHPETFAGHWREACAPTHDKKFTRLHLDLGCGKGSYVCQRAALEPDTLFIGVDQEPICIAYAAQRIIEERRANALVVPRRADSTTRMFATGEIDRITLNFPTPCPKARHAKRRLVYVDRLLALRQLLADEGSVTLRTDSKPLRDYAISQFEGAGYRPLWISDDVRQEHPEHPETEYESRTRALGAHVYGICAVPDRNPSTEQIETARSAEQSLAAYLPEDLESLVYIPLGMEEAVENFKNRARKGKPARPQDE